MTTYAPPPPNPYISETAFSHRFQKVYTYPPPKGNEILAHCKSSQNPGTVPKPTMLAHIECPREIFLDAILDPGWMLRGIKIKIRWSTEITQTTSPHIVECAGVPLGESKYSAVHMIKFPSTIHWDH